MARPFPSIQLIRIFCLLVLLYSSYSWADSEITVVVSSHARPFVEALDGFNSAFPTPFSVQYVDSNPELVKHTIRHNRFILIVAIGPDAAELVYTHAQVSTPKAVLMVLDPDELLNFHHRLCGVHLRISFRDQFAKIRQYMGKGRRVGVLYNQAENGRRIVTATEVATEFDIVCVPLLVNRREDVLKALSSAEKKIDTLLFIPDATVISETMVQYLIKRALLQGIAPVGYNHFFIEAGAVMAFTIDYEKVGIVGARISEQILSGDECTLAPPPFSVEWNSRAWEFLSRKDRHR